MTRQDRHFQQVVEQLKECQEENLFLTRMRNANRELLKMAWKDVSTILKALDKVK